MKPDVLDHLRKYQVTFNEHEILEEVIGLADVVYWTRAQREKAATGQMPYDDIQRRYCIDAQMMALMKNDARLMHPFPRNDEIHPEVDADPRARYFPQIAYGKFMRATLIELSLGENPHAESFMEAA